MADRSVSIALEGDVAGFIASMKAAEAAVGRFATTLERPIRARDGFRGLSTDVDAVGRSAAKTDRSINQLTGRLRLMADVTAMLGPSLIPIGAVGIPAVTGLANQLGVAALTGGTAILAFQGIGDALKAVNTAQLEPTAANLEKARQAMADLSPAARDMVTRLQELRPVVKDLRDSAATGLLPGIVEMFDALETRGDEAERILTNIASAAGDLASEAGADLASERWTEFFDYLATDAPQTLTELGKTVGNFTHGMAQLWMAFDPLNDDFSGWMLDVSRGFDSWAEGLAQTEGFEEFIDYVRTNGPQVAETFAALGGAVLEIVEAAAPLGGPVLQALESVARVIGTIADSELGTPLMTGVLAMSALSRATATYGAISRTTWGGKALANVTSTVGALTAVTTAQERATTAAGKLTARQAGLRRAFAGAGTAAGLGVVAMTDFDDQLGVTNTAMLGLLGTLAGPWGAAAGVTVGSFLDMKASADRAAESVESFEEAFNSGDDLRITTEVERLRNELNELTSAEPWDVGAWMDKGGVGAPRIEEIRDQIDLLKGALEAPEADGLSDLLRGSLPDSLGITGAGFDNAAASADAFRESLLRVSDVLSGRADMREYEASLDDFRASLQELGDVSKFVKDNGDIRIGLKGGRELEAQLDSIAASALAAADDLKGMDRIRFMQRARKDFIAAAVAAEVPVAAARRLADAFGLVNQINAKPKVTPQGIPQAMNAAKNAKQPFDVLDNFTATPSIKPPPTSPVAAAAAIARGILRALDGTTATTRILTIRETRYTQSGSRAPNAAPIGGGRYTDQADGGFWENGELRFAGGGWLPGIGSQPPQIRGSADPRGIVWSEEGAGPWEAFISGHPAKIDRSRMIAEQVASRLDGEITWFADGGTLNRRNDRNRGGGKRDNDDDRKERRERGKHRRQQINLLKKQIEATKELQNTVAEQFKANPYENNATLQGVMASLAADKKRAQEFRAAAKGAQAVGLDGPAFKQLLESGNTAVLRDIDTRAEATALEQAWRQRNRATANLTFGVGTSGRHEGKTLAELQKTLKQLDKAVERGARKGSRDGSKEGTDRTRRSDQRNRRQRTARAGA